MVSYKAIYEKACRELRDTKDREVLVAMLCSWRSEYEVVLAELENSKGNAVPCSQNFSDSAKVFVNRDTLSSEVQK